MTEGTQVDVLSVGLTLDTSQFDAKMNAARRSMRAMGAGGGTGTTAAATNQVVITPTVTKASTAGLRADIGRHIGAVPLQFTVGRSAFASMRTEIAEKIGPIPIRVTLAEATGRGVTAGRGAVGTGLVTDLFASWIAGTQNISMKDARQQMLTFAREKGITGRQMGGPVMPNRPYVVGEGGPELFVPRGSGGNVIPAQSGARPLMGRSQRSYLGRWEQLRQPSDRELLRLLPEAMRWDDVPRRLTERLAEARGLLLRAANAEATEYRHGKIGFLSKSIGALLPDMLKGLPAVRREPGFETRAALNRLAMNMQPFHPFATQREAPILPIGKGGPRNWVSGMLEAMRHPERMAGLGGMPPDFGPPGLLISPDPWAQDIDPREWANVKGITAPISRNARGGRVRPARFGRRPIRELGGRTTDWRKRDWRNTERTEDVSIETLMRLRAIDRETTPRFRGDYGYLDELEAKIRAEGFNRNDPVWISYDPAGHTALMGDGHHRLAVAARMGLTHVPTTVEVMQSRVQKDRGWRRGRMPAEDELSGIPLRGRRLQPDEFGYIPRQLPPSWIGLRMAGGPVLPARFGRRVAPLGPGETMPPRYGETPLRPGYVRGLHYTKDSPEGTAEENLASIRRHGLKLSRARGHEYGEPDLNWFASMGQRADYENAWAIEAHLPRRWFDRDRLRTDPDTIGNLDVGVGAVYRDISRRRIATWNAPWMGPYRYLRESLDEGRTPGRLMREVGPTIAWMRGRQDALREHQPRNLPNVPETTAWDQLVADLWRARRRMAGGPVVPGDYPDFVSAWDLARGKSGRAQPIPNELEALQTGLRNYPAFLRMSELDPERGAFHRFFYENEARNIQRATRRLNKALQGRLRVSARQFSAGVANFSSSQRWEDVNVPLTEKAIFALLEGKRRVGFASAEQMQGLADIIHGGASVTGIKRSAFDESFWNPNARPPVDRWVGRITTLQTPEDLLSLPTPQIRTILGDLAAKKEWRYGGKPTPDVPGDPLRRVADYIHERLAGEYGMQQRHIQAEPWGWIRDLEKEGRTRWKLNRKTGMYVPRMAGGPTYKPRPRGVRFDVDREGKNLLTVGAHTQGMKVGEAIISRAMGGGPWAPDYVAVDPKFQGRGIGSWMYAEAEGVLDDILRPADIQTAFAQRMWSDPRRPFGGDPDAVPGQMGMFWKARRWPHKMAGGPVKKPWMKGRDAVGFSRLAKDIVGPPVGKSTLNIRPNQDWLDIMAGDWSGWLPYERMIPEKHWMQRAFGRETMAPARPAIPWVQDQATSRQIAEQIFYDRRTKKPRLMQHGGPVLSAGFQHEIPFPLREVILNAAGKVIRRFPSMGQTIFDVGEYPDIPGFYRNRTNASAFYHAGTGGDPNRIVFDPSHYNIGNYDLSGYHRAFPGKWMESLQRTTLHEMGHDFWERSGRIPGNTVAGRAWMDYQERMRKTPPFTDYPRDTAREHLNWLLATKPGVDPETLARIATGRGTSENFAEIFTHTMAGGRLEDWVKNPHFQGETYKAGEWARGVGRWGSWPEGIGVKESKKFLMRGMRELMRVAKPYMRAAGGPTDRGLYLVGEVGKELFVPDRLRYMIPPDVMEKIPKKREGGVVEVGAKGPQLFTPPEDGWIIPNHLMGRIRKAQTGAVDFETQYVQQLTRAGMDKADARRMAQHIAGQAQVAQESLAVGLDDMQQRLAGNVTSLMGRTISSAVIGAIGFEFGGRKKILQGQVAYRRAAQDLATIEQENRPYIEAARLAEEELLPALEQEQIPQIQAALQARAAQRGRLAEARAAFREAGPGGARPRPAARGGLAQTVAYQEQLYREQNAEVRRLTQGLRDKRAVYLGQIDEGAKRLGQTNEAVDRLGKAFEDIRPRASQFIKSIAATTAGFVGYGLVMQAAGFAMGAIGPASKRAIDELMGFTATNQRVSKQLAEMLPAAGGGARLDRLFGQVGLETGLSGRALDFLQGQLGAGVTAKAAGAAQGRVSELFRAVAGGGAPQGLYGGYGGLFGSALLAEQLGGGKGFVEQIQGDLRAFSRSGISGPETPINFAVDYLANPDFASYINRQSPEMAGLAGIGGAISRRIAAEPLNPFAPFIGGLEGIAGAITGANPPEAEFQLPELTTEQQTIRNEYIADLESAAERGAKALGMAGTASLELASSVEEAAKAQDIAVAAGREDLLTLAAQGIVLKDAQGNLVTSTKAMDDAFNAMATGRTIPTPEAFLRTTMPQLEASMETAAIAAAEQMGTIIPGQFGLGRLAAPPLAPGVGIDVSVPGVAGTIEAQRQARARVDAIAEAGMNELFRYVEANTPTMSDQFRGLVDDITTVGQVIVGIQTSIANKQLELQKLQYANSLRLARRSYEDAKALAGLAAGEQGRMGAIQRQQWLLNRESQSLSLELNQRQINFQRAVAGFQVPGLTPQEMAARREEAMIAADYAQRQQNIQIELFGLAGAEFTESTKRALTDARRSIDLISAQYETQAQITALNAQMAEAVAQRDVLMQQAQTIISTAQQNFSARLQLASQYVAQFGGTVAAALTFIWRGLYGGGGGKPTGMEPAAAGYLGTVSAPTSFIAGEAGTESVVVLRNPKMGVTSFAPTAGSGVSLTINITGNTIDSEDRANDLVRRVAQVVEESMDRRSTLLGMRTR